MFPRYFLSQVAHEHGLSPEQEQVFLMRVGDGNSYEKIAELLGTSEDACLKRMGLVYKKLNISGARRGKENKLRYFLADRFKELQRLEKNKQTPKEPHTSHTTPQLTEVKSDIQQTNISQVNISQANTSQANISGTNISGTNISGTNISGTNISGTNIYQNLPAREYTAFFGRNPEIARLMELIDFQHAAHLISVDGIGGVGKTTLVVEVAYRCLEASKNHNLLANIPIFAAIIFTSAKQNHLTSIGILTRLTRERTLRDICREIARTLDISEISNLPMSEQIQQIRHKLSQNRTLLIVDNLETIDDKQEVLSFLYDLPPTVKVIMTTREQAMFVPIRLGCLPKEASLRLIEYESQEKGLHITKEESLQLFLGVSGIPAAIIYAIGQMAAGYLLQDVLKQIKEPSGDVARFCFTAAITPLIDTSPHYLLMALSLFVQPVTRDTVADIAFELADPIATSQGLAKLQQLSLVFQQQGRYGLLQLTREYALAELAANREFAEQLRQRWVNWYVHFSESYGGTNWKEWHLSYGFLETEWENLRAVLEWCISQGRYADARAIWRRIKGYTHVRGYWDERLDWTAWLIEVAKHSSDWVFVAEVMCDRAQTLVNMRYSNHLQEAEMLLEQAWDLRHHQNRKFQLELATNMVILCIQQEKWQNAENWLAEEEKVLQQASLSELEKKEQQVHILYYRGQIAFKTGYYQQAHNIFIQALERATTAGWQRATAAIQNWLADIAIIQGNLKQARQLLEISFPMVQRHKDKRSIAYHQVTFAKLEKLSGNLAAAKTWAKEAIEGFESLKMSTEAEEIRLLFSN